MTDTTKPDACREAFEEFHQKHLTIDGYAAYSSQCAWEAAWNARGPVAQQSDDKRDARVAAADLPKAVYQLSYGSNGISWCDVDKARYDACVNPAYLKRTLYTSTPEDQVG